MQKRVLLAFGGNIPFGNTSVADTVQNAIADVAAAGLEIFSVGQLYHTPCFPLGAGPDFVNAAISCRTDLAPNAVLTILNEIEAKFGRERQVRWGSRTLDIDLLAMDDLVFPDEATFRGWLELSEKEQQSDYPEELILPHPRLQDRAFVLVPLADVAPDWRHPVLGQTVVELLGKLPASDVAAVVPFAQA